MSTVLHYQFKVSVHIVSLMMAASLTSVNGLTSGDDLAEFRVTAEGERDDVIVVLEVEGLGFGERVVDHTCSSCMVEDATIGRQVNILTSVETSVTKDVIQRELLRGEAGGRGE